MHGTSEVNFVILVSTLSMQKEKGTDKQLYVHHDALYYNTYVKSSPSSYAQEKEYATSGKDP